MSDIATVRAQANDNDRRWRRRNLILYGYSVFNIVAGLWLVVTGRFAAMHAPMLLMIVAHLFVIWQVWLRLTPALPASGEPVITVHRAELARQQQGLSTAWLWFIAPFMPAFVWELAIWYRGIDPGTAAGSASLRNFGVVVLGAVLFWGAVATWFARQARRAAADLRRLDTLAAG